MLKSAWMKILLALTGLVVFALLLYQLPPVNSRLAWRIDFAMAYVRGVINPVGKLPTALPPPEVRVVSRAEPTPTPTLSPTLLSTVGPTTTPTPLPTPIPSAMSLTAPRWEKQDANNCGPTTLALYLRSYGWEGNQHDIADLLKPDPKDRNVNVEELIYYVRTHAGWLNSEFRVGGDLEMLKKLIAAGIPVMIEESFALETQYWPNDDQWAAHYNLITGYDDATQTFTAQDTYLGPDRKVPYTKLNEFWQSFNRVYIMVYPPEKEETIKAILGPQWDVDYNRQHALEVAQAETEADPENAYTWFNLGTNLVYFERYNEAAGAYDRARDIGLPQRMLRYQFGPFFAYFHARRMDDLKALTDYALQITPNSEEALLWQGWMLYRNGDKSGALANFQQALTENPNYQDAQYAINFVQSSQ
jgi:Peptidase_C39 like family/Tetratricopeptide repeat